LIAVYIVLVIYDHFAWDFHVTIAELCPKRKVITGLHPATIIAHV